MCGIVGMVAKDKFGFYSPDLKVFMELLYATELRGSDGTGIFYQQGKKIKSFKTLLKSSEVIRTQNFNKIMKEALHNCNFIVAHCRAATIGAADKVENVHPFVEKNITLVHNGTIKNKQHLAEAEVDSHAICKSMASIGSKETINKIDGAYTLIWADVKHGGTLNLVRNYERPLYLAETKDLFIFASEELMLKWILDRNKYFHKSCTSIDTNTIYQFKFDNFKDFTKTKLAYTQHNTSNFGNFNNNNSNNNTIRPSYISQELGINNKTKNQSNSGKSTYNRDNLILGEEVIFFPSKIEEENPKKLIGKCKRYGKTEKEHDAVAWAQTNEQAKDWLKLGRLHGLVSHIAFSPKKNSSYIYLHNVRPIQDLNNKTKAYLYKSKNGVELDRNDMQRLPTECSLCGGSYNRDLLHACDVYENALMDELEVYCPDCTRAIFGGKSLKVN